MRLRFTTPLFLAALLISAGIAAVARAEPRAVLRGDMGPALRERIERAVGDVDDQCTAPVIANCSGISLTRLTPGCRG